MFIPLNIIKRDAEGMVYDRPALLNLDPSLILTIEETPEDSVGQTRIRYIDGGRAAITVRETVAEIEHLLNGYRDKQQRSAEQLIKIAIIYWRDRQFLR